MRYSTSGLVLVAMSIGDALAGPTHAHMHRHAHEKKGVDYEKMDWENMGVDWTSAWAAGQSKTVAPAPAQTPAAASSAPAPAATTPAASGGAFKEVATSANSIVDDLEDLWDGLVGCSNSRTSFGKYLVLSGGTDGGAGLAGDFQNGNIGDPYGSNIMKVNSVEGYDFTNTFVNTQSKSITINIWNKGGSDHKPLSGASMAPKDTTLTFTLKPGAKQIVAFMDRSYVSWAEPCSKTSFEGSYATTWGEGKFQSDGSGFDVSAIKNANGNDYDMSITADETPCVSDKNQNMWLTPDHPVGGSNGSCYVPGSKMHLVTKMGGRS